MAFEWIEMFSTREGNTIIMTWLVAITWFGIGWHSQYTLKRERRREREQAAEAARQKVPTAPA